MALATELRSRSESIRARADQNRKVKTLDDLHPLAVRLYVWWRKNSGTTITRENYCHFYRVALIWAPLLYLRRKFMQAAAMRPVQLSVLLVLIATLVVICSELGVLFVLPIFAGGVYSIIGLAVVFQTSGSVGDRKLLLDERQDNLSVLGYLALATSPVYLLCHAIAWFFRTPPLKWTRRNIENVIVGILVSVAAMSLIAMAVSMVMKSGWLFLAQAIGLSVVFVGVCFLLSYAMLKITSRISSRRKVRKMIIEETRQRQALEPVIRRLFELQHPQSRNQEGRYGIWRPRFDRYVETHGSWDRFILHVTRGFGYQDIPYDDMIALQRFMITLQCETQEASKAKRTRISSLWLVVSGVFVIAYHVIREAKTKTCALIDDIQSQKLIEQ